MAHSRTTDCEASLLEQLARGRFTRYCYKVDLIAAQARTNMVDPNHVLADAIKNDSVVKGVFIAPCNGKVVRVACNAGTFATCAAGGTVTVTASKAVIGDTDVDLNTAITVSGESGSVPTAETAIDGTLGSDLDLIEGQLVYVTMAISNHDVTDRTEHLIAEIEFVPTDNKV